jgi:hypothetical protein
MGWTINYSPDPGILHVNLFGVLTPNDTSQLITDLTKNIVRNSCKRILVDCKLVQINFNNTYIYNVPVIYQMMGFKHDCKTAVIVNHINSNTAFYEQVCSSRGYSVKVFENRRSAERWFKKATEDNPVQARFLHKTVKV